jgi:hypothetical protein
MTRRPHIKLPERPKRENVSGKTYIGIDNGVTGSIGIIPPDSTNTQFYLTPVFSTLNYTKEKKNVTRIDVLQLNVLFHNIVNPLAILERPMVNPGRFQATASALRALEAMLITLERYSIPYMFIDSKQWQKEMLPKGLKGSDVLKKASLDIGKRLFPQFKEMYKTDADGMLMAEWARRSNL